MKRWAWLMVVAGLAIAGCSGPDPDRTTQDPSDSVPSNWQTLASTADGFSLRFPPDWGDRDHETGEFLALDQNCGEDDRTPGRDLIFGCSLEPLSASGGVPDFGFALDIWAMRLPRGESAEEYARGSYEANRHNHRQIEFTELHREEFAGATWYVLESRDRFPPTADYGYCLGLEGGPGQCVSRSYFVGLGGRAFMEIRMWAQTPEEFSRFASTAEEIVHTIELG